MTGRKHFGFLVMLISVATHTSVFAQTPCAGSRDLRLINGRIHTMDKKDSVVPEVTIQEGIFAAVGKAANLRLNPCTKVIDLSGRTVVPGLVDNHNHIVLLGMRPGHDIRLEINGRYSKETATPASPSTGQTPGSTPNEVRSLRAKPSRSHRRTCSSLSNILLPSESFQPFSPRTPGDC